MSTAIATASPDHEERRTLPRFAHRLTIGNGLSASPFCLGMIEDWRLVPQAFEMGINFFFITADMHWPLYEQTRRGVEALLASRPGIRDEVVVAGVCYPTQPEFCIAPFDELVDAVPGLERIDVLVAGGAYGPDLLTRVDVMRSVSAHGAARAVGASFHDRRAAVTAANHRVVDLCYIRYNPAHPGAREDLFPYLSGEHTPIYNFKNTMGYVPHARLRQLNVDPELWYPSAADYYRYALSRSHISGVLFAMSKSEHLIALHEALNHGGLTPKEEDHLDQLAVLTRQTLHLS